MIFDCHIHTAASPDGKMTPAEAIKTAENLGLGCIFTEHVDYNPEGEAFFCVDFDVYPEEYIKYKSDSVCLGLELGLIEECVEQNRAHAAGFVNGRETIAYDYILGSVHWTAGFDIGYDPESFFEERGIDAYCEHLMYIINMIEKNDFFDALGHIDYISRYSPFDEKNVLYGEYADIYDKLLMAIVERDKPLELSTRRMGEKSACKSLAEIYSRYHNLGGKYVTLGSDAHTASAVGCYFDTALEMIGEIGLQPVYFRERRMIIC